MKFLITGGAGFIGSSLCAELIRNNHDVVILDDFSVGTEDNIKENLKDIELVRGSCLKESDVKKAVKNIEVLVHLAANPEVRLSKSDSVNCFNRNILATHKLLEAIKDESLELILFTSTSTVYGKTDKIPTPLSLGENLPISLYGASKLASEALIAAYSFSYQKKARLMRLANIVGPSSKHGVVFDFVNKLQKNNRKLTILGDGNQTKSYLYIDDLISAISLILKDNSKDNVEVYNIGSKDQISVKEIARTVCRALNLNKVDFEYVQTAEDGGGWKGDVTNMLLDVSKLVNLGWQPKYNSSSAIEKTVKEMTSARY